MPPPSWRQYDGYTYPRYSPTGQYLRPVHLRQDIFDTARPFRPSALDLLYPICKPQLRQDLQQLITTPLNSMVEVRDRVRAISNGNLDPKTALNMNRLCEYTTASILPRPSSSSPSLPSLVSFALYGHERATDTETHFGPNQRPSGAFQEDAAEALIQGVATYTPRQEDPAATRERRQFTVTVFPMLENQCTRSSQDLSFYRSIAKKEQSKSISPRPGLEELEFSALANHAMLRAHPGPTIIAVQGEIAWLALGSDGLRIGALFDWKEYRAVNCYSPSHILRQQDAKDKSMHILLFFSSIIFASASISTNKRQRNVYIPLSNRFLLHVYGIFVKNWNARKSLLLSVEGNSIPNTRILPVDQITKLFPALNNIPYCDPQMLQNNFTYL